MCAAHRADGERGWGEPRPPTPTLTVRPGHCNGLLDQESVCVAPPGAGEEAGAAGFRPEVGTRAVISTEDLLGINQAPLSPAFRKFTVATSLVQTAHMATSLR